MGNFLKKVEDNIKRETGLSLHDYMAERVSELLMSPKAAINNIKLGIELFGEELEIVKPKDNGALDAHYSMIPPDELEANYDRQGESNESLSNVGDTVGVVFILSLIKPCVKLKVLFGMEEG